MASQVSNSRVSARYAEGLYKAAEAKDCVDKIESDIDELLSALETTPKLNWFLSNPTVERENKKEFVKTVLAVGFELSEYTVNLLYLLIDRNRVSYLSAIGEDFLRLVQKAKGVKTITVSSYVPLSYKEENEIREKLAEATGAKVVKLVLKVDMSLIGGFIIEMDSQIIDLSIKGTIRRLSNYFGIPFMIS